VSVSVSQDFFTIPLFRCGTSFNVYENIQSWRYCWC